MPLLDLPDRRLNYLESGDGAETLLLIHGLGANLAFWYPVITALARHGYRVVAFDLRGHGHTPATRSGYRVQDLAVDVRMLADHLGMERFHIVGHSFGARVALCCALLEPSRLLSVVIADTQLRALQEPVRLCDWAHWPRWRSQLAAQGHTSFPDDSEEINFQLLQSLAGSVEGTSFDRSQRRPSLARRNMGARGTQRWQRLINDPAVLAELNDEGVLVVQALARIKSPVLLVFGEYSHCVPTGDALAGIIPGARLTLIPEAGHFFPATRPRAFLFRLGQFLEETRHAA